MWTILQLSSVSSKAHHHTMSKNTRFGVRSIRLADVLSEDYYDGVNDGEQHKKRRIAT